MAGHLFLPGLPFGEAADGRLVPVADVPSGLACGMHCSHCGRRLVAKKGDIVAHHFAHEADYACHSALETTIHKLAKQIVADAGGITLPALLARGTVVSPAGWFAFDRVELEVWQHGMRPDIVGHRGDRALFVEVAVTHPCGADKLRLIQDRQAATIEIDLSAHRAHELTTDHARKLVLETAPRRWIFNGKLQAALEAILAAEAAERAAMAAADEVERKRMERLHAEEAAAWEATQRRFREQAAEEAARQAKAALEAEQRRQIEDAAKAEARAAAAEVAAAARAAERAERKLQAEEQAARDAAYEAETKRWAEIRRLRTAELRREKGETAIVDAAIRHFKSRDLADVWARSTNPRLGMKSPLAVCCEPDGIERCLATLIPPKPQGRGRRRI